MRRMIATSLAMAALLVGGCSSPAAPRAERYSDAAATGLVIGNQGHASDVVFTHPRVSAMYAGWTEADRPEYARSDASLSLRTASAMSWQDEWPTPARPSLDHRRWGWTITGNRNTFIYYRMPE